MLCVYVDVIQFYIYTSKMVSVKIIKKMLQLGTSAWVTCGVEKAEKYPILDSELKFVQLRPTFCQMQFLQ